MNPWAIGAIVFGVEALLLVAAMEPPTTYTEFFKSARKWFVRDMRKKTMAEAILEREKRIT